MRTLTSREYKRNECEYCGDLLPKGKCPHPICPYSTTKKRKRYIYPRPLDVDKNPYDMGQIMRLHEAGFLAVQIAEMLNLKALKVWELIQKEKKEG